MGLGALIRRYERGRRFWKHVRVGGPDECWPWLGRIGGDGYGTHDGRMAHERAYELSGRRLPPGTSLEHRCGHGWCVNPRHLHPRTGRAGARGA